MKMSTNNSITMKHNLGNGGTSKILPRLYTALFGNGNDDKSVPQMIETKVKKGDSYDHINISITGETPLGRQLAHFHPSKFKHPWFGEFECMEGFWHYINAAEHTDYTEQLRTLVGYEAKEHSKKLEKTKVEGFQEIIFTANFYRIEQNTQLKELFLKSTLPFDYYYYQGKGNMVMRPKGHLWFVKMFEDIRKLMKEGKRPPEVDYTELCNAISAKRLSR